MIGISAALIFLTVTLYGYYLSVKPSKLEKEIRNKKLPYKCFECNEEFSVNELKCPNCSFVTLYGKRRSKYWLILPILAVWLFLLAKFAQRGILN